MSAMNGMSDELLGELFRSLVLKSLEDIDPSVLHAVFNGERGDQNESVILAGLRSHNDKRHKHLSGVANMMAKAQPAPAAAPDNVPRLPSGKKDIFGNASREVKALFRNKK